MDALPNKANKNYIKIDLFIFLGGAPQLCEPWFINQFISMSIYLP
jgi:hypothetical protein